MKSKTLVKDILGGLPFTAELDWYLRLRHKGLKSRFKLTLLDDHLKEIPADVLAHIEGAPSGKKVSSSVPPTGAGSSKVALSVSISAMVSPEDTGSPLVLSHFAMRHSSTVLPSLGASTGVAIYR